MGVMSFVSFSAKMLLILALAILSQIYRSCFPLFDIDNHEIANCFIKAVSFTFWAILGKHC